MMMKEFSIIRTAGILNVTDVLGKSRMVAMQTETPAQSSECGVLTSFIQTLPMVK